MMPRLGNTFPIEIGVTSKPVADYQTDDYFELDLPVAPAVMVGDEIVVDGSGIDASKVEAAIRRHPGPPPARTREKEPFRTPVPQVRGRHPLRVTRPNPNPCTSRERTPPASGLNFGLDM